MKNKQLRGKGAGRTGKVGASGGNAAPHQFTTAKSAAEPGLGGGGKRQWGCTGAADRIARLYEEYERDLRARHYAAGTTKDYPRMVREFCGWLEKNANPDPTQASREDLARWSRTLMSTPKKRGEGTISIAAQTNRISAVKFFYRFLLMEGLVMADPTAYIPRPRASKTLPRTVLTIEEIQRVLSAPDARTHLGYRDRTIFEVLYATGMRSDEMRSLRVEDLNLKDELIAIRQGKGRKDRMVPTGTIAAEYLGGYLKNVRPRLAKSSRERIVFLSPNGRKIAAVTLKRILDHYQRKAGLEKRLTAHVFRHTCATHMLKGGADVRYIQELLGHEKLDTTSLYLRVEITDLTEAHRKYHPRERL